ncbi:hypothetical protein DFH08DRAFT_807392 [Mycena albidolilacea]|uniref:Uncharacterized protein n=1 Tax=Mycena albidolilacea TaxID=1033008 RepID=A0AAD7A5P4_9AGAR|nr:hypothetical protein DFH08DRAFT_807392 [Mycena albidolilacea]
MDFHLGRVTRQTRQTGGNGYPVNGSTRPVPVPSWRWLEGPDGRVFTRPSLRLDESHSHPPRIYSVSILQSSSWPQFLTKSAEASLTVPTTVCRVCAIVASSCRVVSSPSSASNFLILDTSIENAVPSLRSGGSSAQMSNWLSLRKTTQREIRTASENTNYFRPIGILRWQQMAPLRDSHQMHHFLPQALKTFLNTSRWLSRVNTVSGSCQVIKNTHPQTAYAICTLERKRGTSVAMTTTVRHPTPPPTPLAARNKCGDDNNCAPSNSAAHSVGSSYATHNESTPRYATSHSTLPAVSHRRGQADLRQAPLDRAPSSKRTHEANETPRPRVTASGNAESARASRGVLWESPRAIGECWLLLKACAGSVSFYITLLFVL